VWWESAKTHTMASSDVIKEPIKVFLRLRPPSPEEEDSGKAVEVQSKTNICITDSNQGDLTAELDGVSLIISSRRF